MLLYIVIANKCLLVHRVFRNLTMSHLKIYYKFIKIYFIMKLYFKKVFVLHVMYIIIEQTLIGSFKLYDFTSGCIYATMESEYIYMTKAELIERVRHLMYV